MMKKFIVKNFGPIKRAEIEFGDLTLLVGPQASGKSSLLQLLKLAIDRDYIRKVLEQYTFVWNKDPTYNLDYYFGEGMNALWNEKTDVQIDSTKFVLSKMAPVKNDQDKNAVEKLFYIPAQRILSVEDGRPKFFSEFDTTVPFVLRYFSDSLRQLIQGFSAEEDMIFPVTRRLKDPLRQSFSKSIFHNATIKLDARSGQKRFRLRMKNMDIPFMTWSAGQKEFMPLLLGFYWLCPPTKAKRDRLEYVVIEEPEMGLHPSAIQSVMLQIVDLIDRGYKVIVSTHSPILLDFAWFFQQMKNEKRAVDSYAALFQVPSAHLKPYASFFNNGTVNSYFFKEGSSGIEVKDISSLADYDDPDIREWGNVSSFASRAVELVAERKANG